MAASSHPPATLPPPSMQPFRSHSPYGSPAPEPHGASPSSQYGTESWGHHTHHHHHPHGAGPHGGFPPPPPPPYDTSPGGGALGPPGLAAAATPPGSYGGPLPTAVYVAPPKIEMQPWARKAWRWLVSNTTGVARVDLARPTPPLPEQYDGNLLVVRSRQSVAAGGGFGGRRRHDGGRRTAEPLPAYTTTSHYPAVPPAGPATALAAAAAPSSGQPLLMGARIKITRSFLIGGGRADLDDDTSSSSSSEEGEGAAAAADGSPAALSNTSGPPPRQPGPKPRRVRWRPTPLSRSWAEKPLLDIGVGVNLDAFQQQVQPVARIKIKDLVSIKAAPMGLLKISRSIPLGPLALKVRYELPLAHATHFWEPPARLMVRLDSAAGSGVHLTPGGIEFDEQVVQFGRAVSLRASGALLFPRQLPLVEGEPWLRTQLHRISLRSIW